MKLNKQQRRVWEAAYAAAWVTLWNRFYESLVDARDPSPFDRAKPGVAEAAVDLADEAVLQLINYPDDHCASAPGFDVEPEEVTR